MQEHHKLWWPSKFHKEIYIQGDAPYVPKDLHKNIHASVKDIFSHLAKQCILQCIIAHTQKILKPHLPSSKVSTLMTVSLLQNPLLLLSLLGKHSTEILYFVFGTKPDRTVYLLEVLIVYKHSKLQPWSKPSQQQHCNYHY